MGTFILVEMERDHLPFFSVKYHNHKKYNQKYIFIFEKPSETTHLLLMKGLGHLIKYRFEIIHFFNFTLARIKT